ncbi:glycoside hydrolase family 10 protein [Zasmidium cellare ATCC 36951]|uniref:Beta-xylanase n=1 Tax=Zasmidium cellare ATCC 36951 TaxID=1080233 RepID=A0A6A6C386_ZASCE|nr:glycoside hydrolase family 10 protein [Zasmidium cellare ATCC 36951]KAF2160748.1 glycoside hydrolase family 10 protein [Zasmidium cellare ATCC 36951]
MPLLTTLLTLTLLPLAALPNPVKSGSSCTDATTTTSPPPADGTSPSTTLTATATARNSGLNKAARAKGKLWFGTAADFPGTSGELQDGSYMREFGDGGDWGEATPANIMKFDATEPQQNVFNFTGAEQFLRIAEGGRKLVRCHNLIWSSQLPAWVTSPSTPWTNATLSAVLVNHVQTLLDVVNEAFADSPSGSYASNIWYDTIGPEYVALAFKTAADVVRERKLKVKLYYNDYNIEFPGAKATAAQELVRELQRRGIRIDGVGLESHFIAGSTPSQADQEANMNAFAALNVDIAVTELDVRVTLPPTLAVQEQQVKDYYSTVAACVNVRRCIGVTVWDFVDTYSWVPSTFAGQGYADLFFQPQGAGTPLVKKAAYDGCLRALTGA